MMRGGKRYAHRGILDVIRSEALRVVALALPEYRDALFHAFEMVDHVNERGCWVWRGSAEDYPTFWISQEPRLRMRPHRLVLVAGGHSMDGMHSRHECDNRRCINPAHLIPGTAQDNVNDAISRHRHVPPPITDWPRVMRETPHHWQTLSMSDIPVIRRRLAAGDTQTAIAQDYGVSNDAIGKIHRRERWAHVQ